MPSTFQPLRLAYISIVIAVQEASEAASSSCGLGPMSSPPMSSGSSAVMRCLRTLTSWVNLLRWRGGRAHQSVSGLNTMPVSTFGKK